MGAGFVLGMALIALLIVLLRSSLRHLIKPEDRKHILEIEPYSGGENERIKRPAFLSGIQD